MRERTQPILGYAAPEPALADPSRPASRPDAIGARLVGVGGLYRGHTFVLAGETVRLGRDVQCAVVLLNDPTVSRRHARIVLEDRGHTLYDEGSANGTYVNGVLVRRCLLAPGDVLQCGSTQMRYE